ncbi:MAG: HDOD domain-containing protein [Deltaproteobacteria bacterium]|nr:HDOD domain-containing protein [Deltaproteobacteria bacterium]MCX5855271.1 HDOD domain-containing protein [Deltaproteobacteria bacterium]
MDNEIATQIETIELTLVKDSVLGFDPSILFVLDDVEIGQREIENLKSKLGTDIFTYLFNIANSAFHGSLKMGPVKHFFDVVNRLGTQYTKVLILLFAMHRLAQGNHDAEIIYAKSFSASVVGRIMARGFGFRDDGARQVELACLLANVGALMMTVYRSRYSAAYYIASDEFIEQNHSYLTEKIMRRFQLPEYLHEMILTNCFILDRMGIGLPTVVKLAISAVDWSFRTLNNKLVFRSPYTSLEDRFAPSLAAIVEEQFAAAGLKKYLVIIAETDQVPQKMH